MGLDRDGHVLCVVEALHLSGILKACAFNFLQVPLSKKLLQRITNNYQTIINDLHANVPRYPNVL
jgi:hypothetical protein